MSSKAASPRVTKWLSKSTWHTLFRWETTEITFKSWARSSTGLRTKNKSRLIRSKLTSQLKKGTDWKARSISALRLILLREGSRNRAILIVAEALAPFSRRHSEHVTSQAENVLVVEESSPKSLLWVAHVVTQTIKIKTVRRASKGWQSTQPALIVKNHCLQQVAKSLVQEEGVQVLANLPWSIKGAMALLWKEVTEKKKVSPLHETCPAAIK